MATVVVVVDSVFVDIVVVVYVIVVALFVDTDHIIISCDQLNVNSRLLKAAAEFLGWCAWGGVALRGLHSHLHVQPICSVEVVLCYGWGCDNNTASRLNLKTKILLNFHHLPPQTVILQGVPENC